MPVLKNLDICIDIVNSVVNYIEKRDMCLLPYVLWERSAGLDKTETFDIPDGEKRLENYYKTMHGFNVTLRPHQEYAMEEALVACRYIILGDDYDRCIKEFKRKRHLSYIPYDLIVSADRRRGKSKFLAVLAATLALVVPGQKIALFAVALKQCKELIKTIRSVLLSNTGVVLEVDNSTELSIKGNESNPNTTIIAYNTFKVNVSCLFS